MNIEQLISQLYTDGSIKRLTGNVLAQFGTKQSELLGATLLPDQTVEENAFTEDGIAMRTIVALDGARYSPVQKRGKALATSMKVQLGDSDVGSDLTASVYDQVIRSLANGKDMEAAAKVIRWADKQLMQALIQLSERHRWQALLNAQIERRGDNNYVELVSYPNPAGHRVTSPLPLADASQDPLELIFDMADFLFKKGYNLRMVAGNRTTLTRIAQHPKVAIRTSAIQVADGGTLAQVAAGRMTREKLNALVSEDKIPAFTEYNGQYFDDLGQYPYIPDNKLVFIGETDREASIEIAENRSYILNGTLGYYAIGRATGQPDAGRVLKLFPKEDRPARIDGEAYQTTLPVILDPEAVGVITFG